MAERYQWRQGPYNGVIETVNCEDDKYMYFDSGRRVDKEKLNYMMFQTTDSDEDNMFSGGLNTFDDEIKYGTGHDYSGDLGVKINIPEEFKNEISVEKTGPQKITEVKQTKNNVVLADTPIVNTKEEPKTENVSPVAKLLSIQKEDSLSTIEQPIDIKFNLPNQPFIQILLNTFDKELVKKELISYIKEQIDIKILQNIIYSFIEEKVNKICENND